MWKALLLPLCFLAAPALSEELSVEVRVEPPVTPWHRSVTVELSVEAPESVTFSFPEITEKEGQVRINKKESLQQREETGIQQTRQRYVLDPLNAENWLFPSLQIAWQEGDTTGSVETAPMAWSARELTEAEQEFAGHFSGLTKPSHFIGDQGSPRLRYRWLAVAVVILLVLALWLKGRLKKEKPLPPPPPAWTVALNRLRELAQRDLPGQGRVDLYYVDLSAILRYYFEDRFRIPAPEQTSPELLDAVAEKGSLQEEQQHFLQTFLRQCDRVKFARYQPGAEEMNEHFSGVKQLVHQTMPNPSEETTEGESS